MKPTYWEKNLLDYLFGGLRSTPKHGSQILPPGIRFKALSIRFCLWEADLWFLQSDSVCGKQIHILPPGSIFMALGGRFWDGPEQQERSIRSCL